MCFVGVLLPEISGVKRIFLALWCTLQIIVTKKDNGYSFEWIKCMVNNKESEEEK